MRFPSPHRALGGLALGILLGVGGFALAQVTGLTSQSLSGNEAWSVAVGGPQGPSFFTTTGQLRNSTGAIVSAGATSITVLPTTANLIFTAQPAAITITLPAVPFDGHIFEVINGTTAAFVTNVITLQPNTGQTLVGGNITLTTLAAGASRELRYVLSTNSWYPVR